GFDHGNWEGEAPAEPWPARTTRLGRSLALPERPHPNPLPDGEGAREGSRAPSESDQRLGASFCLFRNLLLAFGLGFLPLLSEGGGVFGILVGFAPAGIPLGRPGIQAGAEVGNVSRAGPPDLGQVAVGKPPIDIAEGRLRLVGAN